MGVEPDRLIVVVDRSILIPLAVVRDPAVSEGRRVLQVEPGRLIEVLDRPIIVALAAVRVPAVVEGVRVLRIRIA